MKFTNIQSTMNHSIFSSGYLKYATILLVFFSVGCKDKKAGPMAPPTPQVAVEEVALTDAVYYDEYPATVTALNQVDLRPQVSGFITGVHFADGARVRKGQLLYSIDQQLYSANYQQAVANLQVVEANLGKAKKDANR